MSLIFVTEKFAVDPNDGSPSSSSYLDHEGVIVIQKNGRKTYVKGFTVEEIHELIFGKDAQKTQAPKMLTPILQQDGIYKDDKRDSHGC